MTGKLFKYSNNSSEQLYNNSVTQNIVLLWKIMFCSGLDNLGYFTHHYLSGTAGAHWVCYRQREQRPKILSRLHVRVRSEDCMVLSPVKKSSHIFESILQPS